MMTEAMNNEQPDQNEAQSSPSQYRTYDKIDEILQSVDDLEMVK